MCVLLLHPAGKSRRSCRATLLLSLDLNIRAACCSDPAMYTRWQFTRCFHALTGSMCSYFQPVAHVHFLFSDFSGRPEEPVDAKPSCFHVIVVASSSGRNPAEIFIKHECCGRDREIQPNFIPPPRQAPTPQTSSLNIALDSSSRSPVKTEVGEDDRRVSLKENKRGSRSNAEVASPRSLALFHRVKTKLIPLQQR